MAKPLSVFMKNNNLTLGQAMSLDSRGCINIVKWHNRLYVTRIITNHPLLSLLKVYNYDH